MKDLHKELEAMNAKNAKVKEENTVKADGFPEAKRTYTYRASPAIKASDLDL